MFSQFIFCKKMQYYQFSSYGILKRWYWILTYVQGSIRLCEFVSCTLSCNESKGGYLIIWINANPKITDISFYVMWTGMHHIENIEVACRWIIFIFDCILLSFCYIELYLIVPCQSARSELSLACIRLSA